MVEVGQRLTMVLEAIGRAQIPARGRKWLLRQATVAALDGAQPSDGGPIKMLEEVLYVAQQVCGKPVGVGTLQARLQVRKFKTGF